MSSSVTFCNRCGACLWAGTKVCSDCGSEDIAPTLNEVYNDIFSNNIEEAILDERKTNTKDS
jgi:hypothetical protein